MKTSFLLVALTSWTLSSITPASAQDLGAPASAQDTAAAAMPAMSPELDAPMSRMHENMSAAQQQMDKFRATTDTKGRQMLMRDHMQTMQDSMKLMQNMKGPTMMGGTGQGGMQAPAGKPMAGGEMMKHRDMMQGHMQMMQMMQMMLELMVQQDQMMMESIPAR